MAGSDYTVAVVLQASDEGMSSTIKKAGDEIKNTGEKAQKTKIDLMSTLVAFESLTSGLNQLTGGMRKYSAALEQTGLLEKEQAENFNKQIAYIEMLTGPMETLIAVQKILAVATMGSAGAKTADAEATWAATIANYGYRASILFVLGTLIAFVAVLAALYWMWQNQEKVINNITTGLMVLAGLYYSIAAAARSATESVSEFKETIFGWGGTARDLITPDEGIQTGMGGGMLIV